eukprot:m.24046 g.24046  ORF g.24046 m.24046 type:complete len:205 (+) comp14463_c0_seq1:375-989(+)
MPPSKTKDIPEYKVVLLGGGGVGKSALTIQFIQSHFVDEYDPTIEDSYRKQCVVDDEDALLDILDTAGQEEYESMQDHNMRWGGGFLLVYSIVDKNSFVEVKRKHAQILQVKDADSFPMVLVGNKADLEADRQVPEADRLALEKKWNVKSFETSAKLRVNVDPCFYTVVREMRKHNRDMNLANLATQRKKPISTDKSGSCCVLL